MNILDINDLAHFRNTTDKKIGVTFSCFDLMHSGESIRSVIIF